MSGCTRGAEEGRGTLAKRRDMIDDLIDIQNDFQAIQNPLGGIANTLATDPSQVKVYNPADYKEKPRPNSVYCLRVSAKSDAACSKCFDVCPVDAISIQGSTVSILDSCRKCGLCTMVCPTETMLAQKIMSQQLYDKVARIASAYEKCYVTCTRALGRLPKDNEVLLPCVGAIPSEAWFALLTEFDNLSVYLPLGICDRCRTTTGEEAYVEQIGQAEELSGGAVDLEVDESAMTHEQTRAYTRSQFMSNVAQAGQQLVTRSNPALAGAQAVANRIRAHSRQLTEMQRSLEHEVGVKTQLNRRRILTQKRKVMLAAIQQQPKLAKGFHLDVPACDSSKCTNCGDCVRACVQNACDLDASGHFSAASAYCVNCGACVVACPEGALRMEECDSADLVVRDEEKERREREAQAQREALKKAREQGKRALNKGLDAIERLADE